MSDSLLNKARVRKYALDKASEHRRMADGTPRFSRVGKDFFEQVEACVRNCVESKVRAMPSAGRTL